MDKFQATGTVRGVFFSLGTTPAIDVPKFDCAKAVIGLFDQATTTAHVAIYPLTEPQTVDSIIAAHERGVDVAILADATESKSANQAMLISKLAQAVLTGLIMQSGTTMRTCLWRMARMWRQIMKSISSSGYCKMRRWSEQQNGY